MNWKSKIVAVVIGIALASGIFVAGVYVGGAPLRHSYALSGGPSGRIARQLSHIANHFGGFHGNYNKDQVIEVQVQLAEEQSVLAAQFYCQMTPMYRKLAQRAARRLSASPFIQNATDGKVRARKYLTQTAPDVSDCPSFQGKVAIQRNSALAEDVATR